jgi:hypothetical protein
MDQIMREITNRSALYLIPKEPFRKWATEYNDLSDEDLQSRLSEKHLYLIEYAYGEDFSTEILGPYFKQIFEYELDSWNSYKNEWPQKRDLKLFLEWFEVGLCESILDLEKDEIEAEWALSDID